MSLASLNTKELANKGIDYELLHPKTGVGIGVIFNLSGTDSEAFRSVTRKQRNRRIENANLKPGVTPILTEEESELESLETLTTCTNSWRTVTRDENGAEISRRDEIEITDDEWLKFTPENATRFFSDTGFTWARLQVDRKIGDRTNFLKG